MNCSIIQRAGILLMALMIFTVNDIFAQCGIQSLQPKGCQGFQLNITDTTTGSTSTNWSVQLPAGSVPATVTLNNSRLFSLNTGLAGVLPGVVTVTMTDIVGGQTCTYTSSAFQIYANPVIHGSFSTDTICTGGCVYWNDASSWGSGCTQDSFLMDWTNSQPFQTSPTAQCEKYNAVGSYYPTIILINSCGCRADTTFTKPIVVTAPPSASFTGTNLSSCTHPFTTTLTASSNVSNARYSWYVSSTGTFSSTPAQATGSNSFTYTYPAGTFSIKLVTLDLQTGCTDSVVQTNLITAGANAAACFTASDTTHCAGAITFTPCQSVSGASTYQWLITGTPGSYTPSGNYLQSTNAPFNAYFYTKGTYQARLVVGYSGGCYDTVTQNLHYGALVPISFTSPDTTACSVPLEACLTYTGGSCPGCTFTWAPASIIVPNSASSTGVCYNITSFGYLTPQLTITDSQGCVSSRYFADYISDQPVNIVVTHGGGCANSVISLSDTTSTGGPFTSVTWSFPGASFSSQNSKTAQVSYSGTGCHSYSVTMTSATGCTKTFSDSICIHPKPVVNVTVGPHDLCYEKMPDTFAVYTSIPNDTPTSVQVWPEGILPPGGPSITINKAAFGSTSYMYQDYGGFAICYAANNGGCLGDTICPTLPSDSVHIFPPIPSFNLVSTCDTTHSRVLKNGSTGYTSIAWNFNNVAYPTQGDLTVTLPQCGVNYPVSITAFNDTTGCHLTKSDSISRPCYGVDFNFALTKGCYYAYRSEAGIFFTVPNAYRPTQVLWSAVQCGTSPVFTPAATCCLTGDTVQSFALDQAGTYCAYVQLTYPNGCIDTLVKNQYINVSDPVASYTPSVTAGCIPFCVNFANSSYVSFGKIKHFEWSFGDGSNIDSVNFNPSHCYTSIGQYQACIKIVDTNGCSISYCQQIAADSVAASFSETDNITCLKNSSPLNPITYTSTSTGFVSTYQWLLPSSLGPIPASISGNQSTISEQYTRQGSDSIGLIAIDQYGVCRDTVWKPITVANPVANYALPSITDTFSPCAPLPLCLIDSSLNNICTYSYLLGDGTVDTARNPCHIWTAPGTYPITQVVTSCHGCSDTITKYTIRIAGPTLTTTVDKRGGCPCTAITWTASSTGTDQINFTSDGGTPLFINTPVAVGTVSNPTITQFTATYCNTGHIQPVISAYSNICSPPPFPIQSVFIDTPNTAFTYTLGSCGSDSVCFHNSTTFNAPEAFDSLNSWNFGDGSAVDTSTNPCHHFPGPGNYTVTLTVKDQLLCATSRSVLVHIPTKPVAAYTLTDSAGCVPLVVPFVDVSTVDPGTTMSGYWEFGDGTTANTTANTSHTYTVGGVDNATLVIIDGYGCKDSTTHIIQANGIPNITLGASQTICLGDTTVLSVSGASTYIWNSNYNISGANTATPHVWPRVDTAYPVQIGSGVGCTTYDTIQVFVSKITLSADTATNTCSNQTASFTATASATHATISSYVWTFGDGAASASVPPVTHHYAIYGNYSDTLIVTSSLGCKDTAVRPVKILNIPHAQFSLSLDSICVGAPVIATNTSTAGIGNGGALAGFTFYTPASATVSPDTFIAATVGSNTIELIQTDANQCVDTAYLGLYVYSLPSTFNIEYIICNGDIITLQANTTDSVLWTPNYDINDTTSLTPQVYPAVDFTYYLRVGTNPLCYIHDTVNVVHSVFTVTADTALPVCLGLPSTFTASATAFSATISSYNWNFGDGTGLIGNPVVHQYTAFGKYGDTLIITSSRGCHDTVYSSAIVYDHPHAALSVSQDSVCLGSPFSVTNLSTPGASIGDSSFYFNFGYPPLGTTSPATFTYQVSGLQTITVVEIDSNQCVDSAKGHILVHSLPDANFTYDTSCVNILNQYISNSTIGDGQITKYSWTINGLTVSGNTDSINYTFQTSGTPPICLNVLDTFGCQRDTCINVVIVSKPTFTTVYDSTICAGSSDSISITGLVTGAQWVPATWVSDPNSPVTVVTPLQTVGYQVTVYYHNCTPVVDTVGIWVIDTVPVSATVDPLNIVLGLSSNVTSTVRGTIDSMIWSPDSSLDCRNCRNPIASPHQTTTYTATIYYSKNGVVCSNTANVTVTVFTSCDGSLIYVPNTFTPNNDGVDDIFRLQGQGIVTVEYFRVYDQWGKKVFNAENVDDPNLAAWNGGLNNDNLNKPLNTGVYVYEFQIKCVTGQTVAGKGNITLLR